MQFYKIKGKRALIISCVIFSSGFFSYAYSDLSSSGPEAVINPELVQVDSHTVLLSWDGPNVSPKAYQVTTPGQQNNREGESTPLIINKIHLQASPNQGSQPSDSAHYEVFLSLDKGSDLNNPYKVCYQKSDCITPSIIGAHTALKDNQFYYPGNVLLLGASGHLLSSFSQDSAENSDHMSPQSYTLSDINGTYSSHINGGKVRFILYQESSPSYPESKAINATVTYLFDPATNESCTETYTIKPITFNTAFGNTGIGYLGVGRPHDMNRFELSTSNHQCLLKNFNHGKITLTINSPNIRLHPTTTSDASNSTLMGDISRVILPYRLSTQQLRSAALPEKVHTDFHRDIQPILCTASSASDYHCPPTQTPHAVSDDKLKQESKYFNSYYEKNGFGTCGSCHTGGGVDLALLGYTDKDIERRASFPHIRQGQKVLGDFTPAGSIDNNPGAIQKNIVNYIHDLRSHLHITQTIDPDKFRALQPRFLVLGTYDNNHTVCYKGLGALCNAAGTGLIQTVDLPTQNNQQAQKFNRDLTFGEYLKGMVFSDPGLPYSIDIKSDQPSVPFVQPGLLLMNSDYLNSDTIKQANDEQLLKTLQLRATQMAQQEHAIDTRLLRIGIPFPKWGEDIDLKSQSSQLASLINPSFDKMMPFEPQMSKNMDQWADLQSQFALSPQNPMTLWGLYGMLQYDTDPNKMVKPNEELLPTGLDYNPSSLNDYSGYYFMQMKAQSALLVTWMLANQSEYLPSPVSDQPIVSTQNISYFNPSDLNTSIYRNLAIDRVPFWRVGNYVAQDTAMHPFASVFPAMPYVMKFPAFVMHATEKGDVNLSQQGDLQSDWLMMSRVLDPSSNISAASLADFYGDYSNSELMSPWGGVYPIHWAFFVISKAIVDRAMDTNYTNNVTNSLRGEGLWASNRPYNVFLHAAPAAVSPTLLGAKSAWCDHTGAGSAVCKLADTIVVNTFKMAILNTLADLQKPAPKVFDRKETYGAMLEMYGILFDYHQNHKTDLVSSKDLEIYKEALQQIHAKLADKSVENLLTLADYNNPYLVPTLTSYDNVLDVFLDKQGQIYLNFQGKKIVLPTHLLPVQLYTNEFNDADSSTH